MKKKPLMIVGVIIAVILLLLLALPMFVNANKFKPTLETQLTSALGRKVTIGDLSLAIFSGGVTVSDLAIADDPAFSKSPFLTAKSLTVGVELMPLIFSKRLEVRSITIKEPQVSMIHSANGTWNYSTMGGSSSKTPNKSAPDDSGAANLTVQELKLEDGKIVVSAVGSRAKPSVYQEVNLDASDLSYTSQFPFKLTATGPGGAALKVEGKAGPINQTDSSLTPLAATVNVQHLDLATTGFIDPSSGIAGVIDFKGDLNSDGKSMTSKGTINATKFKLSAAGSPATVPVNIDYATNYDLKTQNGVLSQGDIHIGKAFQKLTGTYNLASDPAKINMKVDAQSMPIGDLEGFLPAVGVVLPSGSKLQGGTLSANLAAAGAVDKLTIAGPVNIVDTELAGFSLSQKLGALGAFAGLGGGDKSGTKIQQLSANIRNDPSGTKFDTLNLVLPGIGTITGNGTVGAAGQLNLKMNAKLSGGLGAVTGGAGAVGSALTAFGGGGKSSNGGGGIPFSITGTTSNPVVVPDVAGVVGNVVAGGIGGVGNLGKAGGGTAGAAASALGGLLGGKPKRP